MRTLLKILQSDSAALWIEFYSLMYEVENVKNIVTYYPDRMMEGCPVRVSTGEVQWSKVKQGRMGCQKLVYREKGVWAFTCKPFTFGFCELLNMLLYDFLEEQLFFLYPCIFLKQKLRLESSLRVKMRSSAVVKNDCFFYTPVLTPLKHL